MHNPHLSVIIPAFNEARRLPRYLEKVLAFLDGSTLAYEVIVVDDGSSDGTADVVMQVCRSCTNLRLVRLAENRGKGFAVKTGMHAAKGALRLFADADGATPIDEVERLMAAISSGAEIAVGSRALKAENCIVKGRWSRKVIGTIFNCVVRMMAVKGICDTQCGFKLFSEAAAERIFPLQRINGFGFDVEVLFIAQRCGYRIAEIPVNWTDIKGTKVDVVRDSFRMFCDVIRTRVNSLLGVYDVKKDRPFGVGYFSPRSFPLPDDKCRAKRLAKPSRSSGSGIEAVSSAIRCFSWAFRGRDFFSAILL